MLAKLVELVVYLVEPLFLLELATLRAEFALLRTPAVDPHVHVALELPKLPFELRDDHIQLLNRSLAALWRGVLLQLVDGSSRADQFVCLCPEELELPADQSVKHI